MNLHRQQRAVKRFSIRMRDSTLKAFPLLLVHKRKNTTKPDVIIDTVQHTESIDRLHNFAEFGKLSSGLFHDLMNTLTAVTMSVHELESSVPISKETQETMRIAVTASKRIGEHLSLIKKQLTTTSSACEFSLNKEIIDAQDILHYYAQRMRVQIKVLQKKEIIIYGHALKFYQVVLNLITNAIDAYHQYESTNRIVTIVLDQKGSYVTLHIIDHGCGISEHNAEKIFEPFFSTKETTQNLGLGLSHAKHSIEQYFNGTISIHSKPNNGTTCIVRFPIQLLQK